MVRDLSELAEAVRRDLDALLYPPRRWIEPRRTAHDEPIYDVLIVGGGQSGLVTAFGLLRDRVDNILVVDENPEGMAGPWLRFARMRTLRTPKHLTGPDLGLPNLTARAWYEAQHGEGSWEALRMLRKEDWAAYLDWYRKTLDLPVRFSTKVGALRWNERERAFEVPCSGRDGQQLSYARRVVLATGIDGSGKWHTPALIREALPPTLYAHTHDPIDFAALRGKRVAVLGAGASAFDNAAVALEAGAREVRMFFRRASLVQVNAYRWAEFVGFLRHVGDLSDRDKWRFISQLLHMGQLPPPDTYRRASELPGFCMQPDSRWRALAMRGDTIVIDTDSGRFEADFVIVGTGFVTDLTARPELAEIEPLIARWQDRYRPPPGEEHEDLLRHPYLGPHFEFSERVPGQAPWLAYLFNYTFGGLLSLGFGGASISGMKYSIPRLIGGLTQSFFLEERESYYRSLCAYDQQELEL